MVKLQSFRINIPRILFNKKSWGLFGFGNEWKEFFQRSKIPYFPSKMQKLKQIGKNDAENISGVSVLSYETISCQKFLCLTKKMTQKQILTIFCGICWCLGNLVKLQRSPHFWQDSFVFSRFFFLFFTSVLGGHKTNSLSALSWIGRRLRARVDLNSWKFLF